MVENNHQKLSHGQVDNLPLKKQMLDNKKKLALALRANLVRRKKARVVQHADNSATSQEKV